MGPSTRPVFDSLAERYDAWYDSPKGREILELESACLRPLVVGTSTPRLEVGIGTGRFAASLGIEVGLDPAAVPLCLAATRGVRVVRGAGEQLPFADHVFGAVVLVVTLCFVSDPAGTVRGARRVLRPDGRLVVGLVPADSAWGRWYEEKGRTGHPFYRTAHFLTLAEHLALLEDADLEPCGARSTLLRAPGDPRLAEEEVHDGVVPGAGFVALSAGRR